MESNRALTISMAKSKVAPADIALALGLAPQTVHHYLSRARAEGDNIPSFQHLNGRGALGKVAFMSAATAKALQPEANARRTTTERLAARLLSTIAAEGMVDAILDDEVARNG